MHEKNKEVSNKKLLINHPYAHFWLKTVKFCDYNFSLAIFCVFFCFLIWFVKSTHIVRYLAQRVKCKRVLRCCFKLTRTYPWKVLMMSALQIFLVWIFFFKLQHKARGIAKKFKISFITQLCICRKHKFGKLSNITAVVCTIKQH